METIQEVIEWLDGLNTSNPGIFQKRNDAIACLEKHTGEPLKTGGDREKLQNELLQLKHRTEQVLVEMKTIISQVGKLGERIEKKESAEPFYHPKLSVWKEKLEQGVKIEGRYDDTVIPIETVEDLVSCLKKTCSIHEVEEKPFRCKEWWITAHLRGTEPTGGHYYGEYCTEKTERKYMYRVVEPPTEEQLEAALLRRGFTEDCHGISEILCFLGQIGLLKEDDK